MSRVTFSSNLTVDHAVSLPEFQNNYGQTADGTSSWGDKGNLTVTMFAKANTLRQVGCRSSEASRLRPHGKPPRCFS